MAFRRRTAVTNNESRFTYAAAIALALGSALLLTQLVRGAVPPPPLVPTFIKAIGVTTLFQSGLFWAPTARGIQRPLSALLMLPGLLIFGGFAGEAIMRIARGYELNPAATIVWFSGVLVYLRTLWRLRRS